MGQCFRKRYALHHGSGLQYSCYPNRLVSEVVLRPLVWTSKLGDGPVLGSDVCVEAEDGPGLTVRRFRRT